MKELAIRKRFLDLVIDASWADRNVPVYSSTTYPEMTSGWSVLNNGAELLALRAQMLAARHEKAASLADLRAAARLLDLAVKEEAFHPAKAVQLHLSRSVMQAASANSDDAAFLGSLRRILGYEPPRLDALWDARESIAFTVSWMKSLQVTWFDDNKRLAPSLFSTTSTDVVVSSGGLPDSPIYRALLGRVLRAQKAGLQIHLDGSLSPREKVARLTKLAHEERGRSPDILNSGLQNVELDVGHGVQDALEAQGSRCAALAYLDLLGVRASSGAFPDTSRGLKGFPIDPATSRHVGYSRTSEGFKVWVAGHDLIDNGGIAAKRVRPSQGEDLVYEFPFRSPGWPRVTAY